MSRLIRPPKPARSIYAPRLSEQELSASVDQSKRDRKRIVLGLVQRAAPVTRGGLPVWRGVSTLRGQRDRLLEIEKNARKALKGSS